MACSSDWFARSVALENFLHRFRVLAANLKLPVDDEQTVRNRVENLFHLARAQRRDLCGGQQQHLKGAEPVLLVELVIDEKGFVNVVPWARQASLDRIGNFAMGLDDEWFFRHILQHDGGGTPVIDLAAEGAADAFIEMGLGDDAREPVLFQDDDITGQLRTLGEKIAEFLPGGRRAEGDQMTRNFHQGRFD